MTTRLQDVADCVAEIEIGDKDAIKLRKKMLDWKADFGRSHRDLMRIPGFAKLWDALDEMCITSLHELS